MTVDRFFSQEISVEVKNYDGNEKSATYKISEDPFRQMIVVDSPISGQFCYEYHLNDGYWKNNIDQHFLEGMLVREFMLVSNGFLSL